MQINIKQKDKKGVFSDFYSLNKNLLLLVK